MERTTTEPIKVTAGRRTLDQLESGEWGAWEDEGCPGQEDLDAAAALCAEDPAAAAELASPAYVVPMLRRWKTRLEVRNRFEALCAVASLEYHRDAQGLYWWTAGFGAACDRMASEVADHFGLEARR